MQGATDRPPIMESYSEGTISFIWNYLRAQWDSNLRLAGRYPVLDRTEEFHRQPLLGDRYD